jgi:hypothetical protein
VSETKELLRRGVGEFEPMPDAFDRVLARRDRMRRNRRVAAAVLGLALLALVMVSIGLIRASVPTTIPSGEGQPTEPPETVTGETAGTWPCSDSQDGPPPQVCFGPLEEGTYTSQRFEPAFTFTVSAGWNNPWDTRGLFHLWTPGWSDGWEDPEDPESSGLHPGLYPDYPGLTLSRDVRGRRGGCTDAVDARAGTSALELATWVSDYPGIATGGPSPMEIGGLAGYQLDVSIAETWNKKSSCPGMEGFVTVEPLDGAGLVKARDFPNSYATSRLILLDLPDGGNVLIQIDGTEVDAAMPVVRSFSFDPG